MNSTKRAVIDWCTQSLRDEPEVWKCDGHYTCEHPNGVRVWVANGIYGLGVNYGWSGREIGGVTFASVFFGWLIPWRVSLYLAAKAAERHHNPPIETVLADAIAGRK